jgi:hypothetical protein
LSCSGRQRSATRRSFWTDPRAAIPPGSGSVSGWVRGYRSFLARPPATWAGTPSGSETPDQWAGPVGRTGGQDRWAGPVGRTGGQDRWAGPVGRTGGQDRWAGPVDGTSGRDQWTGPVDGTSGRDQWTGPVDIAMVSHRVRGRSLPCYPGRRIFGERGDRTWKPSHNKG